MKKIIVALAAVAAIGIAALPSDASAQGRGFGHGGWHGGGGHYGGGGWRGPSFGFYGGPYAYGAGPYYSGCYRSVRVVTPYGVRWRRVWVCG